MAAASHLLESIMTLQRGIRDAVVADCEAQSIDTLAGIADDGPGDTIYAIDKVSEELLIEGLASIAESEPLVLVAEGISGGALTLPHGTPEQACRWRVICDPIDGTRGIMYQKRPAWILTGVAPNKGPDTRLSDIVLAVQSEIPLIKQHLADVYWAERGQGAHGRRDNRLEHTSRTLPVRPSQATSIAHGFATLARFFPGGRDLLAAVDDGLVADLLGPVQTDKAQCFEDQYICTGGQLAELLAGHDRFIADLRPLVGKVQAGTTGLCCHPYDLCTALIAEEAGIVIHGPDGQALDAPLDLKTDLAWCGYANAHLQASIESVLQARLRAAGLLEALP